MSPYGDRLAVHGVVAEELASLSNSELIALLGWRARSTVGIGGSTQAIRIKGAPVFVKLVRVTDRERAAGPGSTANLFDLPTWYQYGVGEGSTGFSAGREVAAQQAASEWVRHGQCQNFPLLYHRRELPRHRLVEDAGDAADIDRAVRFWGNSRAVEKRLRALDESSTVVALFLEHIPVVLRRWLADQLLSGSTQAESAVVGVDRQLFRTVTHLRSEGVSHFDAHFDNVLTDGQQIYVSDFGLATSRCFQLDGAEQRFVALTVDHDLAYCAAALVNIIVGTLFEFAGPQERNDYVRRCARSGRAAHLTGRLAEIVVGYASIATIINDFYWRLHGGDRTADYPAAAIAAALKEAGVSC